MAFADFCISFEVDVGFDGCAVSIKSLVCACQHRVGLTNKVDDIRYTTFSHIP